MKKKFFKEKLKNGNIVLGPWCTIPSSMISNIIASSGMDFFIIDMEHSSISFETSEDMIWSAQLEGASPIIRISENSESLALKALDIGAEGIIIPHIESYNDAVEAVKITKYFPVGTRGFAPFTPAGKYYPKDIKNHASVQNKNTALILLIEGKNGVENLDKILEIKGIDGIYIGAYDLSQSLGYPGQVDHPKVRKVLIDCVKKIRSRKIAAGGYVAKDKKDIKWMIDCGMQIITFLADAAFIYQSFSNVKKDFLKLIR